MKSKSIRQNGVKRRVSTCLAVTVLVLAAGVTATATAKTPPPVFLPGYDPADQQTNFLTFLGKFIPEDSTTAQAYYDAIDPEGKKLTFPAWLKEAGFIKNESEWHPEGRQIIKTGQPTGPGAYGDNIINTDSHVIIINNADLGFVRNQFIRCKPSCTAQNPVIYTYLENYPVDVDATDGDAFPTEEEAKKAIQDAFANRKNRIADVAFDWAPPPDGSAPDRRYGQLYAYVPLTNAAGNIIAETRNVGGVPFAPDLDGLGNKQHPGVCFVCHGGSPQALSSTGKYPSQGRVDGFKFLPLDIPNLLFTSDNDQGDLLSRAAQEAQIKRYNQAVLITHKAKPPTAKRPFWKVPLVDDEQGVRRTTHAVETILGWYGGPTMPSPTQNTEFVPEGWREFRPDGTRQRPPGTEELYLKAVAPACRSCHFQRGVDADFGTMESFDVNKSDILELALKPECDATEPPPGKQVMPLARRTYDLFWLEDQDEYLKAHFGFTSTSYCDLHAE